MKMNKDKVMGALIIVACAIIFIIYTAAIFLLGPEVRIWAVSITMYVAVIVLIALGGWIGYSLLTTPSIEEIESIEGEEEKEKKEAK